METSNNHNLVSDLTSRAIPGVTAIAITLGLTYGIATSTYQSMVCDSNS